MTAPKNIKQREVTKVTERLMQTSCSETISEKLVSQKEPKSHKGAIKRSGKLTGPRIGRSKGSER